MRRYLFLLPLPIAAIAAAVYMTGRPALEISYADVTAGAIAREVLTSGTLEPAREVEAGAQVSGTVQSLHADFNSRVTAGQVIARLDPAVYDTELAQARARVIEMIGAMQRAQLLEDDARTKRDRARALASQDLVPKTELESAELAAKQAEANLTAAQADVASAQALAKQAEVNRAHTIVRSPIDGIVVSRNVEVGQTLAARLEPPVLFRIADLGRMRLLAEVGEAEVGGVSPGSEVSFEIESLGSEQFRGRVSEVRLQPVLEQAAVGTSGNAAAGRATTTAPAASTSGSGSRGSTSTQPATSNQPAASTQSGTSTQSAAPAQNTAAPSGAIVSYTAVIDVDNRDRRIAPGSTAIVMLPTSSRSDAIRIPNNALTFRPSPSVLEISKQRSLRVNPLEHDSPTVRGRAGYVWKYEKGKFVPVMVRTGVADQRWTELIEGRLAAGDVVVTNATVASR